MIGLNSAILNTEQKLIVKDSLVMYVCSLQKQYFRDKTISSKDYFERMKQVDEIANNLHLKELYKHG
tara:strand:- start:8829 stop:9029 length:201 start_codon:yes stop_codon:yes gene_type:complete